MIFYTSVNNANLHYLQPSKPTLMLRQRLASNRKRKTVVPAINCKAILLFCITCCFTTSSLQAQLLWGSTTAGGSNGNGAIYKYDVTTQTLSPVYSLGSSDGSNIQDMIADRDGVLYGVTYSGALFKYTPKTSTYQVMRNQGDLFRSVMHSSDGLLYGVSESYVFGCYTCGYVYAYSPYGDILYIVKGFNGTDGSKPVGSVIETPPYDNFGRANLIWGMTSEGGANNAGVIYSVDKADFFHNTFTRRFDFGGANGANPKGSLIYNNGLVYGMTSSGGANNSGVIFSFEISNNTFTKLYDFNGTDGAKPEGSLTLGPGGKFYGITTAGGTSNAGVLFVYDPSNGTYLKLHDFSTSDGVMPAKNLTLSGDILYGIANGGGASGRGTLFSYNINTSTFTTLSNFTGSNGSNPFSALTQFDCSQFHPSASNNGPLCEGSALNLSANNGENYTWTGPNNFTSTEQNPVIQNVPVSATGLYTVTSSYANGCTSQSQTYVDITAAAGNPSNFGNNTWSVYVWNDGSQNVQPWTSNYAGYYTANGLDFNSGNSWDNYQNPSAATTYQGCTVGNDNFSWIAKRQGFPCGHYKLSIPGHDDGAELWVDGVKVWEHMDGCCDSHADVWEGDLGAASKIEFRSVDINGSAYGLLSFALVTPEITAGGPTEFCTGGSVTLTATAGASYLWSNNATTQNINVTTAGDYSVTVTDAKGCSQQSNTITVTTHDIPPMPVVTTNGNGQLCGRYAGVYLLVSGAAYQQDTTYTWYKAGAQVSSGISPNFYINNVADSGDYTVMATSFGCTSQSSGVFHVSGPPGNPIVFGTNVWNVYVWDAGDATNSNGDSWSKNYSGYYTDNALNLNTQSKWPSSASPSYAQGFQGCFVYFDNHSWSAKRQGFPCGHYKLSIPGHDDGAELWVDGVKVWEHMDGCCDSHANVWEGNLGPDSKIEFRVTEGNGDSNGSLSFALIQPTIAADGPTTFCEGSSVKLTSNIATGNQWYKNATPINGATSQDYIVDASGEYTLQIAATSGCASAVSAPVTVTINPIPATPTITANGATSFCSGGNITLTSSSTTGNQWYKDGSLINGATAQNYTAATAGQYTVQVTANGCTSPASDITTVTVFSTPSAPVITAGGPTTFCPGGSVQLTSSAAASYQWSTGDATQTITATTTGDYSVTVTDINGCTAVSDPIAVLATEGVFTKAVGFQTIGNASSDGGDCYTVTPNATGQKGAAWYKDKIDLNTDFDFTFTTTQCGSGDGMVFVLQTAGFNAIGGTGSDMGYYSGAFGQSLGIELDIYNSGSGAPYYDANNSHISIVKNGSASPVAGPFNISPALANCAGRTLRVTWNHTTHVLSVYMDGTLKGSYTNDIVNSIFGGTPSVYMGFTGGTGGVSASQKFCVNTLQYDNQLKILPGEAVACGTRTLATNAADGSSFMWSTGSSASTIDISTSGNYWVTVTNASGCSKTVSIDAVVTPIPTINADIPVTNVCPGTIVHLTASSGTTYAWSSGAATQSIAVTGNGTYNVTVDGCAATSPVTVSYKPVASIAANGPTTFCPGYGIDLTAPAGVSYAWITGETAQTIHVTKQDNYSVIVTDADGCVQNPSQQITVKAMAAPELVSYTGLQICSSGYGYSTIYVNNFDYANTYTKNTDSLSGDWGYYTAAYPGTYTITATDALGCSASSEVTVTSAPGNPDIYGSNSWNVYVFNDNYGLGWTRYYNDGYTNYDFYAGYYTESNLSFDTRDRWNQDGSPSDAVDYQGCPVYSDYHAWTAKRKGFPCGHYKITIPANDDDAQLLINGTVVIDIGCCNVNPTAWEGDLGPNTTVEFRARDYGGGSFGAIHFELVSSDVVAKPVITPSGSTTICSGGSVTLTSDHATGNVWSNGATSQSILVSETGNYYVTVTGSEGCTAQSNPVQVTVSQQLTWYLDADNDGYYTGNAITQCASPGVGYKSSGLQGGGDCKDNDATIYPGAPELCDGKDNNCNNTTDEGCLVLTSFTLVNATTGQDIQTLTSGTVIDLATISGKAINIRANTSPQKIGSVIMNLSGTEVRTQKENILPYTLFGDNEKGTYNAWYPKTGSYALQAIPYSAANGKGVTGSGLTVSFSVVDNTANILPTANAGPDKTITLAVSQVKLSGSGKDVDGTIKGYAWSQQGGPNTAVFDNKNIASPTVSGLAEGTYVFGLKVTDDKNGVSAFDYVTIVVNPALPTLSGLTLVNAATDKDIGPLVNGTVIDLAVTPSINVRANPVAGGTKVASVRFGLNTTANYKLENIAPFTIAGDNEHGDYYSWVIAPGTYTLSAKPYGSTGGKGVAGTAVTITITIKKGSAPTVSTKIIADQQAITKKQTLNAKAIPNPTTHHFVLLTSSSNAKPLAISVTDVLGRVLEVRNNVPANGTLRIGDTYLPGTYFVEIKQGAERVILKLIKQPD